LGYPEIRSISKSPSLGFFNHGSGKRGFLLRAFQRLTAVKNDGTSLCRAQATEKLCFSTACSRKGLKNSELSPAQGCADKINRAKRLILWQVAKRVCDAACSDKSRGWLLSELPKKGWGMDLLYPVHVSSAKWGMPDV